MKHGKSKYLIGSGYFGESDVYDWLDGIVAPVNAKFPGIVEIKFKGSRKEFFINKNNIPLEQGELVAVSGHCGGYDIGLVSLTGELVRLQLKKRKLLPGAVLKKIYRKASAEDMVRWKMAKDMEEGALPIAKDASVKLGLRMKFCDADYQADLSMVTLYYTAGSRVDFRELIIVLSKKLQVYVRMRQIGLWEESRRLGSIGPCGKAWCCHNWSEYMNVTCFQVSLDHHGSLNNKEKGREGRFECYIKEEDDSRPVTDSTGLIPGIAPIEKRTIVKEKRMGTAIISNY
jgi:cell fate regulator YaaT (PSP1 superfamily)